MPWNDNANPGPWGAPGGGDDKRDPPPGRRPTGGGPRGPGGPDLGAGLDRLSRRMRQVLGGPGGLRPGVVMGVAAAAFAAWVVSGFYLVQPSERAVVFTFGRAGPNDWTGPGLNYHLPAPIQHVEKVAVTTLNFADVGGNATADAPTESLMLTGDQQIVDMDFRVTWRVENAANFLFAVRDADKAVKAVAESAMREVVGETSLQPIISTGRGEVQRHTAELMQKTLDSWGAGISIVEVQIRQAQPPPEVIAAFRDVNNATQDADSAQNEANIYRNRVINEAKGDAATITQQAEAYREQATRTAFGDAARFNALYAEYRRAPGVTRDRIYIETMQQVLQASNKVIIDSKGASAPIILPPDVFRPKAQAVPQIEVGPAQAAAPKGGGQ